MDQYARRGLELWLGGMENTSATTMFDTAIIARWLADRTWRAHQHELAHQWFGNLVTCNSWSTSGSTRVRTPHRPVVRAPRGRRPSGRDPRQLRLGDRRHRAPETPAMVSKVWGALWRLSGGRTTLPARRSVLHMLRQRLGDDAFFAGCRCTWIGPAPEPLRRPTSEGVRGRLGRGPRALLLAVVRAWAFPGSTSGSSGIPPRRLNVRVDQSQHIDGTTANHRSSPDRRPRGARSSGRQRWFRQTSAAPRPRPT